jgi:LmbE family N-acetylglucosaminyl deacetylase
VPRPHPDTIDTRTPALPVPSVALAVSAHPDDAEIGAGGTLAAWAAAGCRVTLLIVTDGSKGTWDQEATSADLIARRRQEQEAAAGVLGAERVVFLDHVDGELEYSMGLRAEICLWVRRLRPQVVLGHDPWRRYMLHPDHRVTGIATVDGVVAARDHLFFPEQLTGGLTAHRPQELLLWFPDEADHWEDVSGTLDRKVAALLCHTSQSDRTMNSAAADPNRRASFEQRIRDRAAETGAAVGLAAAEAFRRLET